MSFSKETKAEICSAPIDTPEYRKAAAYGMALFSRTFSASAVSYTTKSRPAAMLYSEIISSMTGAIVEIRVKLTRRGGENSVFTLSVPDKNDCQRIFEYFGHSASRPNLRINRANIENDQCVPYFLRGVFLVCGNVTDPDKDYHLEFVVPHKNLAADLEKLISDIEEIDTEPHTVYRKGSYVVYIKGSDNIEDMLAYIGAGMSSLSIIQSKMFKSVRNRINRQINSETANINKTAEASARQLKAIEIISEKRGLDSLPDELKELAELRMENPEYNLRELGASLSKPLSRSGVNHRLNKLIMISEELSGK
ncbi:MAG: DNA-binding protein WhiA [Clostridia bacterium]|nr:DNA-binding protein WhiA [Clostridia bacterium]